MGSESFCLRWNDFESNISHAFKEIHEAKDFQDVTLVCEEHQLKAHKLLLSACSPVLYKILQNNPHQNPLIYLRGVRFKDVEAIVKFMYSGEVSVSQDELSAFLDVAEDLKIRGLTATNPTFNLASDLSPDQRCSDRTIRTKSRSRSTRSRPSLTDNEKSASEPPSKRTRNHLSALSHLSSDSTFSDRDPDGRNEQEKGGGGGGEKEFTEEDVVMLSTVKPEIGSEIDGDTRSTLSPARSADVVLLEADVNIEEGEETQEEGANLSTEHNNESEILMNTGGILGISGLAPNPEGLGIEELANVYLRKNSGGGGYQCTVCGRKGRDRYAAQDHLECQHFPSYERYTCDICGKKLNARKLYLGHKGYCSRISAYAGGPGAE